MQRCSKQRLRAGFALSLLLILAVTFWGLHDKVLSGRELAADTANQVQAVLPPDLPTPTISFLAFAFLLALPVAGRLRLVLSHVPFPPCRPAARTRALDRRPPPCF